MDSLRGRAYDPQALMDTTRSNAYWCSGGFRLPAVLGWALAIVAGLLLTKASTSADDVWFAGPLSDTWCGVNGLGWAVSTAVAAAVYTLCGRRGTPARFDSGEPAATRLQEAGR